VIDRTYCIRVIVALSANVTPLAPNLAIAPAVLRSNGAMCLKSKATKPSFANAMKGVSVAGSTQKTLLNVSVAHPLNALVL